MEETVATTALGAAVAATVAAEPARTDPAALSAMMAGMMMFRLMGMIPPRHTRWSDALRSAPSGLDGASGLLPLFGYFMH